MIDLQTIHKLIQLKDVNPVLIVFKLLPYLVQQVRSEQNQGNGGEEPLPKVTVLDEKDLALLSLKKKKGAVTVILGTRDTGKTELAYRFAEFLGRKVYAVSPEQQPPSWIERIIPADILEIPPWSTVIGDDLPAWASNRDYNVDVVQAIEKLIPMCRHEKCIQLIFSTQSAAQADKYILDCDLAFLKPLGLFKDDFERPNIAKIYRTYADPEFEGKSDHWIVRHAYMWSRQYKGIIKIEKTGSHST